MEDDIDREISRIIQIISERGEGSGAMFLGHEAFSWNYRFIFRFLKRYGGHANRILFRITTKEKQTVFNEVVAQFGIVLRNTLRRSDIIVQHGSNQFFVVLPLLSCEDTPQVIGRVMSAWERSEYHDMVGIEYTASPVSFGEETTGQTAADQKRGI